MFGWFKPTCPCDPAAKAWVETRLSWLTRHFGLSIMLERPIILPTAEFFPDPWDGSPAAVRQMFRRVCGYMGVKPNSVNLEFYDDATTRAFAAADPLLGVAAGTWSGPEERWQKSTVRLEKGGFDRPADLVGIMAHELAHQRSLGEGRMYGNEFDNELLTDLTAVFHGFGVFLANNSRKHVGEVSCWPGTKLHRPEYLSEPMLGYTMAHIAGSATSHVRHGPGDLRRAPRAVFNQGPRFLNKTADSTFRPIRIDQPPVEDTP